MATMTLTVGANSTSRTIAAGDVTRVLAAVKTKFGLPGGATNQQVIDATADWVFNELVTQVLTVERKTAAKTAEDAVAGIPLT